MDLAEEGIVDEDSSQTDSQGIRSSQMSAQFEICCAQGLHTRPSHQVVTLCSAERFAPLELKLNMLAPEEKEADPRSILGLMTLGAASKSIVELNATGCTNLFSSLVEEFSKLEFLTPAKKS